MIEAARAACKMNPAEMRAKRDAALGCAAKLPVCLSLLSEMRSRVWAGRGWSPQELKERVMYLACMWGYDLGARVSSEYTRPEGNVQDHGVRVHDLEFTVDRRNGLERLAGGHDFFKAIKVQPAMAQMTEECDAP